MTTDAAALATYLNDHLAGAAAGIRLARRIRDADAESDLGTLMDGFLAEFEEDRATLRDVMQRLGVSEDPFKEVGARAVELVTRAKQLAPVVGRSPQEVARLEDVELLSLGIEGRRLLWHALRTLAPREDRLKGVDLASLEDRAAEERDRLEVHRLRLVADAAA